VGFLFARYVFGGEDVFYVGYQNNLLACNMNNGKWHRTRVSRPNLLRWPERESSSRMFKPERESSSRLFKPSLFRFDGGGQLWDSYQCGIDPSHNAPPMWVDDDPMMIQCGSVREKHWSIASHEII
jgi:hypothetical protein